MGLLFDSSILVADERRGKTTSEILQHYQSVYGDLESALSVITIVELTHGVYRAKTDSDRERRQAFCDELVRDMVVHPVTVAIAQLAGKIEGEQAARGNRIAFEDLVIGATALHLGFEVVTLNVKHFQAIPNLGILTA